MGNLELTIAGNDPNLSQPRDVVIVHGFALCSFDGLVSRKNLQWVDFLNVLRSERGYRPQVADDFYFLLLRIADRVVNRREDEQAGALFYRGDVLDLSTPRGLRLGYDIDVPFESWDELMESASSRGFSLERSSFGGDPERVLGEVSTGNPYIPEIDKPWTVGNC